ncbi:TetR/AcrR family transcriptional regulator [Actinoalloteichus sp. AHMU CJ021]|nr:TetR/AcrR family transcriptional regulator [Actinoalloteichus sp. AHMU CJ021]
MERMLTACAELVSELGYDGVTTTLIAERAGVAVGSLYQFFPDKRAVVQELTLRNLDSFLAELSKRFADPAMEHWSQAADAVFDLYISMHRTVPGFSSLHFGDVVDLRLLDGRKDNNMVLAERLTVLFANRFDLPPDRLKLPLAVAIEAADAVLNLAFREDPDGEPEILAEARAMVRGYLATRLDT